MDRKSGTEIAVVQLTKRKKGKSKKLASEIDISAGRAQMVRDTVHTTRTRMAWGRWGSRGA